MIYPHPLPCAEVADFTVMTLNKKLLESVNKTNLIIYYLIIILLIQI